MKLDPLERPPYRPITLPPHISPNDNWQLVATANLLRNLQERIEIMERNILKVGKAIEEIIETIDETGEL
jgi:hypothetical protein